MLAEADPALLQYASPAELQLIERAAKMEMALSSPLQYALYVTPNAEAHAHLKYLDEILLALVEHRLYIDGPGLPGIKGDDNIWRHPLTGELVIIKLAISMPPRHGKSFLVSEHLPAWFVSKWPDKRVVLASYEADFAASWGLKARRHIENHPEFGVKLDQSSRSGARWDVASRSGGMITAGAGGPLTGKGGHILIGDDLVKNDEEAMSAGDREKKEDWWTSTFSTRVQPGGDEVFVLMATRWHEDDIVGRVTTNEAGKWYVINLPALAFPETDEEGTSIDIENGNRPDPLGRKPNEALAPKMFSTEQLERARDTSEKGKIWFSALHQGRPSLEDGGIFPKSDFRYYVRRGDTYQLTTDTGIDYMPVKHGYRFVTADLAASVKTSADWTVFSAWDALPGNRLVLVDRYRSRMESSDHEDALVAFVRGLDPEGKIRVHFVGVEKATYGLTLIQNLIKHPRGLIVRSLDADKDKVSRALPAGLAVKNHQVFFPKEATWLSEWETELTKFDKAPKDDQVDTFAYAVQVWVDLPVRVREVKHVPATPQEKVEAHVDALIKRKKHGRRVSTVLGRWG